ncbi:MAG TPA: MFS transporter [Alphaproteobacteria bacterium]|nr:MFS transporter [Alphaproteobacteria bacterium]
MDIADRAPSTAGTLTRYATLWLLGASLRITLLAVPPVIPLIHQDLGLSETAIGMLTSIPVLLLALAAVSGSLLVARLGLRRTLLLGLAIVAVFTASRGVGRSAAVLFGSTFLMGIGIAVLQPAAPTLVKTWFPFRVGMATAVYTNGLIVGEILGVGVTLPLARGSWAMGLALWSLLVLATALLVHFLASSTVAAGAPKGRWWPDWRDKRTWQIGLILGASSGLYFAANAFIPDYLHAVGADREIGPCLTALNVSQLLAPLPILLASGRIVGQRLPFVLTGCLALLAVAAIITGISALLIPAAVAIGFSTAFILTLSLALPPLLVDPEDVHRLSAGIFTIAYFGAVILPVIGGKLWDLTGFRAAAFTPCAIGSILVIALGAAADLRERHAARS